MKSKLLLMLLLLPVFWAGSQTQVGETITDTSQSFTDRFGTSVSMSCDGNIVAAGAIFASSGNNDSAGAVRVYENNNVWSQIGTDINGENRFDELGQTISLSCNGDIVAVGAPNYGRGAGKVRVFQNIGGSWSQIGESIVGISDAEDSHFLGTGLSLSCDGTILAIGASSSDFVGEESGHVDVYQNVNNSWELVGERILGLGVNNGFGFSVSLSCDGTILAVSAPGNSDKGREIGNVTIYENIGNVWTQMGEAIFGENMDDASGVDIDLSCDGKRIAITSISNSDTTAFGGHARLFEYSSGDWVQVGDDIDGTTSFGRFGDSVSLSCDGSIVAIGASESNDRLGSAQVFKDINNVWTQIGTDIVGTQAEGSLGLDVSLSSSGDLLAVGVPTFLNIPGSVKIYDLSAVLSTGNPNSNTIQSIVYPNPAANHIRVALDKNNQLHKIDVFDITGKKVLESNNELWLDISTLSSGTYFVNLSTNNGISRRKIVVK